MYSHICDKHIIPTLGNILLFELKPYHLQRLYADKLSSGLSNRTVQIIHITLHKALKNAVKAGLLARNVSELRQSPGYTDLSDSDLVFSHYNSLPLLPNSVTHAWIKLVRRCGLHGIRLHDARHTHTSLLLKQGVHPRIVQERLGHGSIQITLDTYRHVAPGLQQAAANKFDDIVLPEQKATTKTD